MSDKKNRPLPEDLRGLIAVCGVVPQTTWVHVRTGNHYRVVAVALREDDLSVVVVYARDGVTWARPLIEFRARFEEAKS